MHLSEIVSGIQPVDQEWMARARERTAQLVMPARALGRLHDISEQLCGIQRTLQPSIERKAVLVMAGDHGIAGEGVSAYPQEVTAAMVHTFLAGGAGINAIGRHVGADVFVVDVGTMTDLDTKNIPGRERLLVRKVARGTASFARGPAMSLREAEQSIIYGFQAAAELFRDGVEIIGTGDMGIGNTTPSAAIATVICKVEAAEMVGRGTGVDEQGLARKQDVVRRGIEVNHPKPDDGLDILSKIGGFEIGGIAGIALAGAFCGRAVIIDGFISTAGALIADLLCPTVKDYLLAGHCSAEPGHRHMLDHLHLNPILDLGLRLGEGTGAALAMSIVDGALKVFKEVMTFEEAGVAGKES